jgi:hypothetical protein
VSAKTVAAAPPSSGNNADAPPSGDTATTPGTGTGGGNEVAIVASVAAAVVLVLGAGVCVLLRRRTKPVNFEGGSATLASTELAVLSTTVEQSTLCPAEVSVSVQVPGNHSTSGKGCDDVALPSRDE